jgi:hypothetical protein
MTPTARLVGIGLMLAALGGGAFVVAPRSSRELQSNAPVSPLLRDRFKLALQAAVRSDQGLPVMARIAVFNQIARTLPDNPEVTSLLTEIFDRADQKLGLKPDDGEIEVARKVLAWSDGVIDALPPEWRTRVRTYAPAIKIGRETLDAYVSFHAQLNSTNAQEATRIAAARLRAEGWSQTEIGTFIDNTLGTPGRSTYYDLLAGGALKLPPSNSTLESFNLWLPGHEASQLPKLQNELNNIHSSQLGQQESLAFIERKTDDLKAGMAQMAQQLDEVDEAIRQANDRAALEALQARHAAVLGTARVYGNLAAQFVAFANPERGAQLGGIIDAGLRMRDAMYRIELATRAEGLKIPLKELSQSTKNLQKLAAYGEIVSAAVGVISLFDHQPSADQLILSELHELRQQMADFSQHMDENFLLLHSSIQASFATLTQAMDERFLHAEGKLASLSLGIDRVQDALTRVQTDLSLVRLRLRDDLQSVKRLDLAQKRDECLGTGTLTYEAPLTPKEFQRCLEYFRGVALTWSDSNLFKVSEGTGKERDYLAPAELRDLRRSSPLQLLDYLSRVSRERFGNMQADGESSAPDADMWSEGVEAFVESARQGPAKKINPAVLSQLQRAGEQIRRSTYSLIATEIGANPVGEARSCKPNRQFEQEAPREGLNCHFQSLLGNYESALTKYIDEAQSAEHQVRSEAPNVASRREPRVLSYEIPRPSYDGTWLKDHPPGQPVPVCDGGAVVDLAPNTRRERITLPGEWMTGAHLRRYDSFGGKQMTFDRILDPGTVNGWVGGYPLVTGTGLENGARLRDPFPTVERREFSLPLQSLALQTAPAFPPELVALAELGILKSEICVYGAWFINLAVASDRFTAFNSWDVYDIARHGGDPSRSLHYWQQLVGSPLISVRITLRDAAGQTLSRLVSLKSTEQRHLSSLRQHLVVSRSLNEGSVRSDEHDDMIETANQSLASWASEGLTENVSRVPEGISVGRVGEFAPMIESGRQTLVQMGQPLMQAWQTKLSAQSGDSAGQALEEALEMLRASALISLRDELNADPKLYGLLFLDSGLPDLQNWEQRWKRLPSPVPADLDAYLGLTETRQKVAEVTDALTKIFNARREALAKGERRMPSLPRVDANMLQLEILARRVRLAQPELPIATLIAQLQAQIAELLNSI